MHIHIYIELEEFAFFHNMFRKKTKELPVLPNKRLLEGFKNIYQNDSYKLNTQFALPAWYLVGNTYKFLPVRENK